LFQIKLYIRFQAFTSHSIAVSWKLHVCHKLSNNQFTLFNCMLFNSFCLYLRLACFSDRIQVISQYQRFILIRLFAWMFISQNHQLNKDDSILNLLFSKYLSKACLDLYLKRLFIDMIWILQVLNTLWFDSW
jgi:hypothetical protein